ncbi:MAG TPA: hypothetical protein PKD52_03385 [Clostridiales bacterium]|nr:hypothetical protein [Clostridiales bacterium]
MCINFLITLVLVGMKNENLSSIVDNSNVEKKKMQAEELCEMALFCTGVLIVPAKESILFV